MAAVAAVGLHRIVGPQPYARDSEVDISVRRVSSGSRDAPCRSRPSDTRLGAGKSVGEGEPLLVLGGLAHAVARPARGVLAEHSGFQSLNRCQRLDDTCPPGRVGPSEPESDVTAVEHEAATGSDRR